MPGAYEKQMHGPRYDRMCENVTKCRQSLMSENYGDLMTCDLPMLTLNLARDRSSVEELFYAGGFDLMCDILSERSSNRQVGDVTLILREFSSLLSKEFDPFDEDIGEIPLLVFFLCERHKFYVDINWNPHELTYMRHYIEAHISLISSAECLPEATRTIAVANLYMALLTFPPHRVCSQMANCFSTKNCAALLSGLNLMKGTEMWETSRGRRRLLQVIASIAFFGLGLQVTREVCTSQLVWALQCTVGASERCPCDRCEFNRRLQKICRARDEFGVPTSPESKQQIVCSLIQSGVLDFITDVLDQTTAGYKKRRNDASFFAPQIPSKECSADDVPAAAQPEVENDDPRFDDNSRQLASWIVMLCSWEFEAKSPKKVSILSHNDYRLLASMLSAIDLSDLRKAYVAETGTFLPGVRTTLDAVSALVLRKCAENTGEELLRRVRPQLEAILRRICEKLVESSGTDSRGWKPEMGTITPLLSGLVAQVYLACKIQGAAPLPEETFQAAIAATQCLMDGYEWGGIGDMSHSLYLTTITTTMCILVGGIEYFHMNSARRRYQPPPKSVCSFLSSYGRHIQDLYDKLKNDKLPDQMTNDGGESSKAQDESLPAAKQGCVYIRDVLSVTIARAEKASALLKPEDTESLANLKEKIIKNMSARQFDLEEFCSTLEEPTYSDDHDHLTGSPNEHLLTAI